MTTMNFMIPTESGFLKSADEIIRESTILQRIEPPFDYILCFETERTAESIILNIEGENVIRMDNETYKKEIVKPCSPDTCFPLKLLWKEISVNDFTGYFYAMHYFVDHFTSKNPLPYK